LLRNVFWRYLLPFGAAMLAFVGHVAWLGRSGGWLTALVMAVVVAVAVGILAAVYWLNQKAVRSELEPRRQELEVLLTSLSDETPAGVA
jgi:ABC-type transport system involved in cytochrome bd biosynthesis fused ATPase/permease subunit